MAGRSPLSRKQQRKVSARIRAAMPKSATGLGAATARLETATEDGPGDTIHHLRANGVALEIEKVGSKAADIRHRRKPGLLWLHDKGRLTREQYAAGTIYGDSWRIVQGEHRLKSCLNDSVGGSSQLVADIIAEAEKRAQHRMRLASSRAFVHFHVGMIRALDAICGEEKTPREVHPDRDDAERLEHDLRLALDMLVIMGSAREAA